MKIMFLLLFVITTILSYIFLQNEKLLILGIICLALIIKILYNNKKKIGRF